MTDDDVDFAGDLIYARGILDEIADDCYHTSSHVAPIPSIMSSTLDVALELVRRDFPDHAAALLADWRAELDGGQELAA